MQTFSNEAAFGPDYLKGAEVCQGCAGGGCKACDWYGRVDRTATVAPQAHTLSDADGLLK